GKTDAQFTSAEPHARVGAPWVGTVFFAPSVAMHGEPGPRRDAQGADGKRLGLRRSPRPLPRLGGAQL
ncbi:MAG: Universal stress protein UspA and related nucleotide-binding proteins, partial [uncultured Rubrobacteraceae bacterium]